MKRNEKRVKKNGKYMREREKLVDEEVKMR